MLNIRKAIEEINDKEVYHHVREFMGGSRFGGCMTRDAIRASKVKNMPQKHPLQLDKGALIIGDVLHTYIEKSMFEYWKAKRPLPGLPKNLVYVPELYICYPLATKEEIQSTIKRAMKNDINFANWVKKGKYKSHMYDVDNFMYYTISDGSELPEMAVDITEIALNQSQIFQNAGIPIALSSIDMALVYAKSGDPYHPVSLRAVPFSTGIEYRPFLTTHGIVAMLYDIKTMDDYGLEKTEFNYGYQAQFHLYMAATEFNTLIELRASKGKFRFKEVPQLFNESFWEQCIRPARKFNILKEMFMEAGDYTKIDRTQIPDDCLVCVEHPGWDWYGCEFATVGESKRGGSLQLNGLCPFADGRTVKDKGGQNDE